jgi:hypothetical protein
MRDGWLLSCRCSTSIPDRLILQEPSGIQQPSKSLKAQPLPKELAPIPDCLRLNFVRLVPVNQGEDFGGGNFHQPPALASL